MILACITQLQPEFTTITPTENHTQTPSLLPLVPNQILYSILAIAAAVSPTAACPSELLVPPSVSGSG